ncbi:MAG: LPS export ABC transporter ATP-binding protein [Deltaproteobacteria bacterium]|nr:LPS export ABC transporter ATP-binding protein [Deltaproteobacteria bacterium]
MAARKTKPSSKSTAPSTEPVESAGSEFAASAERTHPAGVSQGAVLEAFDLVKSYRKRKVVRGVSVYVNPGEVVGLLGPNGAGKTTTFYMIAGVVPPDEGRVILKGGDVTRQPLHIRARQGLCYLPQERSVFRRLTVEDNLRAAVQQLDVPKREAEERIELALTELGLLQIRKSLGFQLSGGEARRTEIARALVMNPAVILLDEPFAGVDPIAVLDIQDVVNRIKQMGIGVLITDHNVRETLGITDRAYIVSQGQVLVSGNPDELVHNEIARKIYLGDSFTL